MGPPQSAYIGVQVSVTNTIETQFMRAIPGVNVDSLDVGATARSCAGTVAQPTSVMPWALQEVGDCYTGPANLCTPVLGERCTLKVGSGLSNGPLTGTLGVEPGQSDCFEGTNSANDYRTNITDGINANCFVGGPIPAASGNMHGPTRDGTETRLATEGGCDAAFYAA